MRRGARPAGRGPVSRPAGPRRRGTRPPDVPNPGGSSSFAGTATAGSLGPVAASEMGPVIGLPNPGGVPRPAVSHMQPVGPGGSPGGRLGEGRETRHTRATADGPRDGVVTRAGPGRGRTGAAALPTVPESGSRLRSDPPRLMRPAGLGGPVRRGGWSGNHTPRAPVDSGLPLLESVRGTKWRSGRIVPLRTRLRCRRNRGITRKSPGVSEVPVRTILPERQNQVPLGFPAPAARSAGCPTGAWPAPTATRPRGPVTGSCPAAP